MFVALGVVDTLLDALRRIQRLLSIGIGVGFRRNTRPDRANKGTGNAGAGREGGMSVERISAIRLRSMVICSARLCKPRGGVWLLE